MDVSSKTGLAIPYGEEIAHGCSARTLVDHLMSEGARVLLVGSLDYEGLARILAQAIRAGYRVNHAAPEDVRVCGTGAAMTVWKLNEPLPTPDVVVHSNIRVVEPLFGLLEAWERRGIPVLNSPQVGHAAVNKWSQQDLLDRAGIPHPHTELVTSREHVHQFAEHHGYPFVVKPAHGSRAHNIIPIGEYRHIRERVEPVLDGRAGFVAQQLVPFTGFAQRSRDRKAVVVDGRIVTVMERTGSPGEVAASRHGEEESIDASALRPDELKYLPAAAAAIGTALCTVDYWLTDDHSEGLMVNEVNVFPALPPREAEPFAAAVVALIGARLTARTASTQCTSEPDKEA
jgi:glutathione synthase/RimK-type ligase-like ATP-grasp enzyme